MSYGKAKVGILQFICYLLLVVVHTVLFVWFVTVLGPRANTLFIAVGDTVLFFSSLYLLHRHFRRVFRGTPGEQASTQPGGAPDAAAPRR
jgi:hypothetical protein